MPVLALKVAYIISRHKPSTLQNSNICSDFAGPCVAGNQMDRGAGSIGGTRCVEAARVCSRRRCTLLQHYQATSSPFQARRRHRGCEVVEQGLTVDVLDCSQTQLVREVGKVAKRISAYELEVSCSSRCNTCCVAAMSPRSVL